jgi:acyl-CoA oxidase
VKALSHVIKQATMRLAKKGPKETERQIIDEKLGVRLLQLAQLHGVYTMVNQLSKVIEGCDNSEIKALIQDLCKLFAAGQIQRLAEPIIEGGFICPLKWAMLSNEKELALKRIRPHAAVLIDSFGIPEKYLRSEVISGNPYQNFLNRAR